MRCCNCSYKPILSGYYPDECLTDVCELVSDEETTEYLYKGRFEIGCKFNLPTLRKRKKLIEEPDNYLGW